MGAPTSKKYITAQPNPFQCTKIRVLNNGRVLNIPTFLDGFVMYDIDLQQVKFMLNSFQDLQKLEKTKRYKN